MFLGAGDRRSRRSSWVPRDVAILRERGAGPTNCRPDTRRRAHRGRLDGHPAGHRPRRSSALTVQTLATRSTPRRTGRRQPQRRRPSAGSWQVRLRRTPACRLVGTVDQPAGARAARRRDGPRHADSVRRDPLVLRARRSCSSATRSRVADTLRPPDQRGRHLPRRRAPSSAASATRRCRSPSGPCTAPSSTPGWRTQRQRARRAARHERDRRPPRSRTAARDRGATAGRADLLDWLTTTDHKRIGILYIRHGVRLLPSWAGCWPTIMRAELAAARPAARRRRRPTTSCSRCTAR